MKYKLMWFSKRKQSWRPFATYDTKAEAEDRMRRILEHPMSVCPDPDRWKVVESK